MDNTANSKTAVVFSLAENGEEKDAFKETQSISLLDLVELDVIFLSICHGPTCKSNGAGAHLSPAAVRANRLGHCWFDGEGSWLLACFG